MKLRSCFSYLALVLVANSIFAAEPAQLIDTIKSVGREGKGNVAAGQALRELSQADAKVLPTILGSFDDANPLAVNYLRSAVETIADRTLNNGKDLPLVVLERFVLDTKQNPRARRLAYEWIRKSDSGAEDRMIPSMLLDPSPEFRRDAVDRLIQGAKQANDDAERRKLYLQALKGATDDDQVKAIVKPLREKGEQIDLQRHFGFLPNWQLIGPFNNRDLVGFAAVYPPEKEIKLETEYKGQLGQVKWAPQSTKDDYGLLDIGKQIKNYKGSVMYATTEFVSDRERPIEFRLGTPNAWKIWLNGKFLFGRDEYHRGTKMDQYRVSAKLKPGKNRILLKICQNEQEQSWAQRYQFQIRVCDASGIAVLPTKQATTSQLESK